MRFGALAEMEAVHHLYRCEECQAHKKRGELGCNTHTGPFEMYLAHVKGKHFF